MIRICIRTCHHWCEYNVDSPKDHWISTPMPCCACLNAGFRYRPYGCLVHKRSA